MPFEALTLKVLFMNFRRSFICLLFGMALALSETSWRSWEGGKRGEASAARSGGSGGRELVCRVSVELSPHLDLPPQRRGADVTVLPDDLQELPGGLCGFIEKTRQGGARGATVVSTR